MASRRRVHSTNEHTRKLSEIVSDYVNVRVKGHAYGSLKNDGFFAGSDPDFQRILVYIAGSHAVVIAHNPGDVLAGPEVGAHYLNTASECGARPGFS